MKKMAVVFLIAIIGCKSTDNRPKQPIYIEYTGDIINGTSCTAFSSPENPSILEIMTIDAQKISGITYIILDKNGELIVSTISFGQDSTMVIADFKVDNNCNITNWKNLTKEQKETLSKAIQNIIKKKKQKENEALINILELIGNR